MRTQAQLTEVHTCLVKPSLSLAVQPFALLHAELGLWEASAGSSKYFILLYSTICKIS